MALGQAILVASEAAPCLLRPCFRSSLGQMLIEVAAATDKIKRPAARTNKPGEFLFLYVGGTLDSFPLFKCTDFVKCVREL
jgi:hypothetical protein